MNSIDRNQAEDTQADLAGPAAVERIRAIVAKAESCFFCTAAAGGGTEAARPMNVRRVDDDGTLWFLSAADSHKNAEVAADPAVRLYFQGSPHSDFLVLDGTATITTDREIIRGLWEPILRTWFTGGVDDPRATAIRVAPAGGHYWTTKHGNFVAGVKMLVGAALGRTMDDSLEGRLDVSAAV